MKLSVFRHLAVISGTGVGGGSLVYANTLPVPKRNFFTTGSWEGLADWENELQPFYRRAQKMLGVAKNPKLFDSDLALKEVAEKIDRREHFASPEVGVYFGKPGETVKDPYFGGKGPDRTGCTFCGGCMTGCRYNAKNSLEKNYLWLAQKKGVSILSEQEVYDVRRTHKGYEVVSRSSTSIFPKTKKFKTKGVIFSGGVLGTVKLLLKLKGSSLPKLSDKVGADIRSNNETLISVSSQDSAKDLSEGVAIGSILHTDDHSHLEVVRYSAGSGFWKLLHLPVSSGKYFVTRLMNIMVQLLSSPVTWLKIYFFNSWSRRTSVLLFMQTLDSTLRFRRTFLGTLATGVGRGKKPSSDIPESRKLTEIFSEIINGKATSFALESLGGIPTTAHILGGAVMGKDASEGVINSRNEVFGYDDLYVIDGSMISSNPGVNPSLSITAIAERAMSFFPDKS